MRPQKGLRRLVHVKLYRTEQAVADDGYSPPSCLDRVETESEEACLIPPEASHGAYHTTLQLHESSRCPRPLARRCRS
eukprot:scaffold374_cov271-Pinguiococcus_pyrenoidosus.AAC.9